MATASFYNENTESFMNKSAKALSARALMYEIPPYCMLPNRFNDLLSVGRINVSCHDLVAPQLSSCKSNGKALDEKKETKETLAFKTLATQRHTK